MAVAVAVTVLVAVAVETEDWLVAGVVVATEATDATVAAAGVVVVVPKPAASLFTWLSFDVACRPLCIPRTAAPAAVALFIPMPIPNPIVVVGVPTLFMVAVVR